MSNLQNQERMSRYHWIVVILASLGWLFDCMDQRLFVLAREAAVKDLLGGTVDPALVKTYIGYATTSMILGWATGGIIIGMYSDRYGRVRALTITLLLYSIFTGLSGLAHGWVDFVLYRFIAGIGIGGMFGSATTLVAESIPGRFRAPALGALQTLAAIGNVMGSMISLVIPPSSAHGLFGFEGWRSLFFIGIIPALIVVPMMRLLREPEVWLSLRENRARGIAGTEAGSVTEMFRHPKWRKHALVGLGLGVAGMIGLWGIGFFSPELISEALKGESQSKIDSVRSWGTALQDIGSFLGMASFTFVATFLSRRLAFLCSFILCFITTVFVFSNLNSAGDAMWMLPLMGFAQLSLFAGYSIYFPELFPTRLRGTGVGFCYNTVRYLAAPAPLLLGYLSVHLSFRSAACIMAGIYILGAIALIWAPETKGKDLPEEEPA
ncbi:MFS transporter [Luteolibacter algae]|uniref:MFS transporter n=1 Tax=Luteolibacter algae TaxID=454151 RepID=A0ABW5D7R9_9BACT